MAGNTFFKGVSGHLSVLMNCSGSESLLSLWTQNLSSQILSDALFLFLSLLFFASLFSDWKFPVFFAYGFAHRKEDVW